MIEKLPAELVKLIVYYLATDPNNSVQNRDFSFYYMVQKWNKIENQYCLVNLGKRLQLIVYPTSFQRLGLHRW